MNVMWLVTVPSGSFCSCLVALVSEDLGLLPDLMVTRVLGDAIKDPPSSYDLLGGLFRAMNTPGRTDGGRFTGVDYFNGGLFAEIDPVELKVNELYALETAAKEDWSAVKPEIFGTIFQQSMDKGERHAFGAHFTSEFDIQKVVGPTIVRPWRERIEAAGTMAELRGLLGELRQYRVLDPACGSGNFLYVAYREMKRLERELLVRLRDKGEKPDRLVSAIALTQFFGIDKVPFAVELARVTLMLAKELELAEAKKTEEVPTDCNCFEKPLPLDNLDQQIICADSLFSPWPKVDAIIGNPPYLDARKLGLEHGDAYVKKVRSAFSGVPGRADFCVYWFRKAHEQLGPNGRAGLVGTNTIRQNYSREGGLDYIVANGGTISGAVSTEVWSGDAQVHVSIVNWTKGEVLGEKVLTLQRGDRIDSPWETYTVNRINSALSIGCDVSTAIRLDANSKSTGCFEGQQPGHDGFRISASEAKSLIDQGCEPVILPYLNGDELLGSEYIRAPRFIIDFGERDTFAARQFDAAMQIVRERVLPDWQVNAANEQTKTGKSTGEHQNRLRTWWQLKRQRKAMVAAISKLPRYAVCVRHTKRPIFEFLDSHIRPDSSFTVFAFADDYSFGVLQSGIHFGWFTARCSTIKADFRYTSDTVFDTFPWPQMPSSKQIERVAAEAVTVRLLRRQIMDKLGYSLRELYRTLEEPGANPLRDAHCGLDAAVRAAYGMPADADPLAFLLALNLDLAAKEKKGKPITPPGLPLSEAERTTFVTTDCITI